MRPTTRTIRGEIPRRSLLHFAGAGLAIAVVTSAVPPVAHAGGGDESRVVRIVRRFMSVIESRDIDAIWNCFGDGGAVEFPFLGARFTDLASLRAGIGGLMSQLDGLQYSDVEFERLAARGSVVLRYHGHATIASTGKSYSQTYITEARVDRGRMVLWREYFDTAVLNAALTP